MTVLRTAIPLNGLETFCQKYQVRELALFGSALRVDFGPHSDIDILVEFEPQARIGFIRLSQMQRELSALLNRPVDLVPKAGLKPRIRQAVLGSAEIIYAA